jgi:autotransporter-associated beta strand protein
MLRSVLCLVCLTSTLALAADGGAFRFSSSTYEVTEPTGYLATVSVTVTVARVGGSAGAATVNRCCWMADGLDSAGPRVYGSGGYTYNEFSGYNNAAAYGTLEWADGETNAKTFTVTITADATNAAPNPLVEGTETLTLRIISPRGGARLGWPFEARLLIHDFEAPAAGVFNLTQTRYFTYEPETNRVVTVTRSGGSRGTVSVSYTVNTQVPDPPSTIEKLPNAAPGSDYTAVSGTLTWGDGDTSARAFDIPINNDGISEGPELANIVISYPQGGAAIGTVSNALLTIADDDKSFADVQVYTWGRRRLRVWVPQRGPIRGLFMYKPGSGGDSRWIANYKQEWKNICQHWGFAQMGMYQDFVWNSGLYSIGESLDVMRLTGGFIGRPELANAPYMFTGYSLGGLSSGYAVQPVPERAIGWVGYMGGVTMYFPNPGLSNVPGLMIAGQKDYNSIVGFGPLRKMFLSWRTNHMPVAYCVSWGVGHKDEEGQSYELGLLYLNECYKTRYPSNAVPGRAAGDAVHLHPIDPSNGWFAQTTDVGAPAYDIDIGDADTYGHSKDTASWLPSEEAARYFRAFTSIYSSYLPDNFPPQDPLQCPARFLRPTEFQSFNHGQPVALSSQWRVGYIIITNIVYSHGLAPLATETNIQWYATVSNAPPGPNGVEMYAKDHYGLDRYAFQIFTVLGSDPPREPDSVRAAAHGTNGVVVGWNDRSGDEDGFVVQRRMIGGFEWTNVASVGVDAVDYVDMGATMATGYCYRVYAFNSNGMSRVSAEACCPGGTFTWSGLGGTSAWAETANWVGTNTPAGTTPITFPPRGGMSPYASGTTITLGATQTVKTIVLRNDRHTGDLGFEPASPGALKFEHGAMIHKPVGETDAAFAVPLDNSSYDIVVDVQTGSVTLAAGIDGSGALVKRGPGALIMSGPSRHGGATYVTGGRFVALNRDGSAFGSGGGIVASGAALAGTGTITGAVSVNGEVAPGLSTGTLYAGSLTLAGTAVLALDLGQDGASCDHIAVASNVTLSGTIELLGLTPDTYGTYNVLSYGGALTDNGIGFGPVPDDLDVRLLTDVVGRVEIQVTPEPCGVAAVIALAFAARRRKLRG